VRSPLPFPAPAPPAIRACLGLAVALGAATCGGRYSLLDAGEGDAAIPNPPKDADLELAPDGPPDAAPGCVPTSEVCNGLDDDCNGTVDDGLPPIACAGGGSSYCIAGKMSECPRRCEVCLPGSERICFISYCTYWGAQSCAADGRSFGPCHEEMVPHECAKIVDTKKRSRELEQCCLDSGYCCKDEFDLDGDGDHAEMLGRCESVACTP